MTKLLACSNCGIKGVHACLGSQPKGVGPTCGILSPKAINRIKRELDFIDRKAKEIK